MPRLADILTPIVRATNNAGDFLIERVAMPLYEAIEEAQSRVNLEHASRDSKRLGITPELTDSLRKTHAGQWVALENAEVVATGDTMQELLGKVGDRKVRVVKVADAS